MAQYNFTFAQFTGLASGITEPYAAGMEQAIVDAIPSGYQYCLKNKLLATPEFQVFYDRTLTGEEQTTLNGLVTAHDGVRPAKEPEEVKLAGVNTVNGLLETTYFKPPVISDPFPSQRLDDATTWWQESVAKSGALQRLVDGDTGYNGTGAPIWRLPDGQGGFYSKWIDVEHGKCGALEGSLPDAYKADIYMNGALTPATKRQLGHPLPSESGTKAYDCHINYQAGYVEFVVDPPTINEPSTVTADIYVAQGSGFTFTPPYGSIWKINKVEVQFSDDAKFLDKETGFGCGVIFDTQLWANDPSGNPVSYIGPASGLRVYKTKQALIDEANYHYRIPAPANPHDEVDITEPVDVHGWDYEGAKILRSKIIVPLPAPTECTVRLRVSTEGDKELVGSYASMTCYVLQVEEEE